MSALYSRHVRHGVGAFVCLGEVRWVVVGAKNVGDKMGCYSFVRDPSLCRLTRHQLIPTLILRCTNRPGLRDRAVPILDGDSKIQKK